MRTTVLLLSAISIAMARLWTPQAHAEPEPNRIRIEYEAPTKDDQKQVYELMKSRQALEKVQELFSPFRLPVDLLVKTKTCGKVDTSYQREGDNAVLTICYEYISDIFANLPKEVTPVGITPADAMVGQFFYIVGHEMGRAMFDLLEVPVLGRPSDAADNFSVFIMLKLGPQAARRLIAGAAYSYKHVIEKPDVTIKMQQFSDVHGPPAQRFYNLVCMGYGAYPPLFADVVQEGFLPKERASNCYWEHREVAYGFRTLIRPHLDPELTRKVLAMEWLPLAIEPPKLQ